MFEKMTHEEAEQMREIMADWFDGTEVEVAISDLPGSQENPAFTLYSYVGIMFHGMCTGTIVGPEHWKAWLAVAEISMKQWGGLKK